MSKNIVSWSEEDIEAISEEVEATFVERVKNAREEAIRAHWETGEILERHSKGDRGRISALVHQMAARKVAGLSERTLWFCVKFKKEFAVFEKVYETEHGQNVSVNKLKQLIAPPKPKEEPEVEEVAQKVVDRFGSEKARQIANVIIKLCDKLDQNEKGE